LSISPGQGNRPGFPPLGKPQQGFQRPPRPGGGFAPQQSFDAPESPQDQAAAEARAQLTELERLRALQLEAKQKGQSEQLTFRPQVAPVVRPLPPSATLGQSLSSTSLAANEGLGMRVWPPPFLFFLSWIVLFCSGCGWLR
jgi:hypothetical protein